MPTITADQATADLAGVLQLLKSGPVRITKDGNLVAVMLSPDDAEGIRWIFAARLRKTLDRVGQAAVAAGMDSMVLNDLLADES